MYFFCSQVPVIINEIDKSTQRGLNFIFHEISEYNFFITMARTFLLTFLSLNVSFQKKAVSEHQFCENKVVCECCHEKLWGFTLVATI